MTAADLVQPCECILQQNKVTVPKKGSNLGSRVPAITSVKCDAKFQATLQKQFTYAKSFCLYMEKL